MSLKVIIKNDHYRRGRVIRVESPDVYGLAFTSETVVDNTMLEFSSIRFDVLIDDAVRKHCRQVADAMFRDWKEGR